jgi:hypothetical protein
MGFVPFIQKPDDFPHGCVGSRNLLFPEYMSLQLQDSGEVITLKGV